MKIRRGIRCIILGSWRGFNRVCDWLIPAGDLLIRYWVAKIFFLSGLTKIQSWQTTIMLFTYEYHVPLLPPHIVAYMGTAMELIMPVFLLLGLGGRVPAFALFVFNIVAVVSYPFLLTKAGHVGLMQHFYWGLLLMVTVLHGSGKLSVDYFITWLRRR